MHKLHTMWNNKINEGKPALPITSRNWGKDPHWQRGGNGSNDCTILSCLNCPVEQLSTFVGKGKNIEDEYYTKYILKDLDEMGISYEHSIYYDGFHCPYSQIFLQSQTGSRTIIYINPDLPELTLSDFQKLNLENYSWVHFEGRNGGEQGKMMQWIRQWNETRPADERIKISLEMELSTGEYEFSAPYADYIFVSKELAGKHDLFNKEDSIKNFWIPIRDDATLVLPWGSEGAAFRSGKDNDIVVVKAYPPPTGVVDTLAAGDSFISSTFYALSRGHPIEKAVDFGCRIAGYKVGVVGLKALQGVAPKIYQECFG
ncbi:hypothetical protein CHUAL_007149 [Chamberlinius hualienensis]